MFPGILRFEWRYQTRRLTFAAVATVFALVGFGLAATGFGGGDVHVNSPYSIALSLGLASLLAVLAATFFCAQGALRDSEHRMAEIVFATAVTRSHYVFGRFAGVAAATLAAFACVVPGLLAGTFAVAHEPGRVGPLAAAPYLWAFAMLAVPNLLLVCAGLFAVALTTRSAVATYVGGVLAYGLYFVAALFSGSPLMASSSPPTARGMAVAALADPFGLSAFFAQTRYWTAAERDVELATLDGALLVNRLLWLLVAALLLAVVYHRFAFRLPDGSGRSGSDAGSPPAALPALRRPPVATGTGAALRALASATRLEVGHAVRSWPLVGLLVGWLALATIELAQTFRHAELGSALLPTTGLIVGELRLPLSLFGLLLLVYFAAELVWRERTAGMAELVDATPVPGGVLLTSKVLALGALVALLTGVAAGGAMAFQLLSGWTRLEPWLHASLLLHVGLPLMFVAVLVVFVQALVPNRHVGILVSALAVAWWHLGALGGPQHPLLRFGAAPAITYSDLAGFGPETLSFTWFSAYWGAFAVLLLAVGCGLWRRGTDSGLGGRLAALRQSWSVMARGLAAAAVLLWLVLGALVFQQTNRWNSYRTPEAVESWKAAYERTYGFLENAPQPTPVGLRVEVDLQPEQQRYEARGSYVLENRTDAPIDTLWVVARRDLARARLLASGRPPAAVDATFGTYRFALSPALPPGGRTTLDFDVAVVRRGAVAGEPARDIVRNGTFLLGNASLPSIGYRRTFELDDATARRRQGLAPRTRPAALEGAVAASVGAGPAAPWVFEATLTTAPDQIALAPGTLVGSGRRGGRNFFRYRAEGIASPFVAFASGRYAVERSTHGNIDIEVYHHPAHGRNVEAMLDAAARALDYCREQFGPYPHRELRIVEVPSAGRFAGFAIPGTIFVAEYRGFLTDRTDPHRVDVVTKRVAHEVAHQWWGHQVSPVDGPGASAVVETLARYTEQRVLAGLHGERAVPPVLAFELDRYLVGHTAGDEPPLAAVEDQPHVYYAKGALVMAAIHDLIGERSTNAALRRLVDDARAGRQPGVDDLVSYLQHEAGPEQRGLIDEWWRGIVLYDLRVAGVEATALADGRARLEVLLEARRSDRLSGGERALPIDEEIEVAIYAADPGIEGSGEVPLQVGRHRVRGAERITLEVDAKARWILVDPGLLRIDRNRADNLRAIGGMG